MSEPRVPMLDLRAQHAAIADEIAAALARVVASQRFVAGPEVASLEQAVATYCETDHAVACGSGSDALLLSLMDHGIGPGHKVICPAFTFFATAGAVARLGAEPVFADVDPDGLTLSVDSVKRAIDRAGRPDAIIAVHLFGRVAAMDELLALAGALGVPIIEDAAQSIGARDSAGLRAGSRGDGGCLSFYPTKNLGAYGDGGMILCRDAARADRLRVLRNHGATSPYQHDVSGINSRLDAIQAAVLLAKLPHLDAWTAARQGNAAAYQDALSVAGAGIGPGPFVGLGLPIRLPSAPPRPASHVFHQYVIRVPTEDRSALRAHLAREGVDTAIYYPIALHRQPCFAGLRGGIPSLPESEAAARECLALPVHAELGKDQQARVVAGLCEFFAR